MRIVVRAVRAHVSDVVKDGGVDDVLHWCDDAVGLRAMLHYQCVRHVRVEHHSVGGY